MMAKDVKRGRLRRVTIKHMYNEDGNLAGHTVTAEHEPDMEAMKAGQAKGNYVPSPPDIETPHETHDSAMAKVKEHHEDNLKRFGGEKKTKGAGGEDMPLHERVTKGMADPMVREAMGRKK